MKIFEWLDRKIEIGKPGPEFKRMTTMDLDKNNKLYPDFLKRRAARKKARKAEKDFTCGQVGEDVY